MGNCAAGFAPQKADGVTIQKAKPITIEIIGENNVQKVEVSAEPSITEEVLRRCTEHPKFLEWKTQVAKEPSFKLTNIHFQSVDMFGKNVGFMKFACKATNRDKPCPGIVFMRGGAPAILVILKSKSSKELYTVIVTQARLPVGFASFAEIPAGMLDEKTHDLKGVAAEELKEETGIQINEADLINMSKLAHDPRPFLGMYPSCGGSDEYNPLFLFRKELDDREIQALIGKEAGTGEKENEYIKVKVIKLDDLWKFSSDGKALSALCLYQNLRNSGKLPAAPWKE